MCLAKVYFNTRGENVVFQKISKLRVQDGKVELEKSTGESKVILGKVIEVDFSNSRVLIDETISELNIV